MTLKLLIYTTLMQGWQHGRLLQNRFIQTESKTINSDHLLYYVQLMQSQCIDKIKCWNQSFV